MNITSYADLSYGYQPAAHLTILRVVRIKNRILLDNYCLSSELDELLQAFVNYYNHERYHESLNNLTPADVFFGRGGSILKKTQND
jgi:hypothetical protein